MARLSVRCVQFRLQIHWDDTGKGCGNHYNHSPSYIYILAIAIAAATATKTLDDRSFLSFPFDQSVGPAIVHCSVSMIPGCRCLPASTSMRSFFFFYKS